MGVAAGGLCLWCLRLRVGVGRAALRAPPFDVPFALHALAPVTCRNLNFKYWRSGYNVKCFVCCPFRGPQVIYIQQTPFALKLRGGFSSILNDDTIRRDLKSRCCPRGRRSFGVRSLGFSRKSDLSGNRASGNPEPPHLPAKKPRQVTTSALLSIAFTCW